MTTRRICATLLLVMLTAAITLVVAPAGGAQVAAGPVTVVETGWWSLRPGAPLPTGAFQIAQNPSGGGDMTVAAVKFQVSAKKLATALFVMGEAASPLNFRNDTAGVLVCRTNNDWTAAAANPGLLVNAPERDCSRTIQLQRSPTLKSWSADLLPFLDGRTGLVSLLLVPGAPAPGSVPITSIENLPIQLPSLPVPAIGGVPIPPPLPAPLEYPDLPASIPAPIDLGYTLEVSNIQMGAAVPDVADGLSAAGPLSVGDLVSGVNDFALDVAPPLSGAADTATGSTATAGPDVVAAPELASSSGPGKPWGRSVGLFFLAILIGAGGAAVRRALSTG